MKIFPGFFTKSFPGSFLFVMPLGDIHLTGYPTISFGVIV